VSSSGLILGHPSGTLMVSADSDDSKHINKATVFRTARRLMEGQIYWKGWSDSPRGFADTLRYSQLPRALEAPLKPSSLGLLVEICYILLSTDWTSDHILDALAFFELLPMHLLLPQMQGPSKWAFVLATLPSAIDPTWHHDPVRQRKENKRRLRYLRSWDV